MNHLQTKLFLVDIASVIFALGLNEEAAIKL